jgi:hypothetical protein
MQIYQGTGVTDTGIITLTKGVGSLAISHSLGINSINAQRISVWVERAGKNKDIANDVLLKDFLLAATYGEDILQSDSTYATIGLCELTNDGGFISLSDGEVIKLRLQSLNTTDVVRINGIEEPIASNDILTYERKTMASDILNQDFDVTGYDLIVLTKDNTINEIALTFDNGAVCKFLGYELEILQKSIDGLTAVSSGGVITSGLTDRYVLPLKGVTNVNIRKNSGVMLNLTLRIDEFDFNANTLRAQQF